MARLTRSGVAHDLTISPYKLKVVYEESGETLTYVFSSEFYLNKFVEKAGANREKINKSLSNRFGFTIENNILADIKLYLTTETRGFMIEGTDVWQRASNIKLNGVKVMSMN